MICFASQRGFGQDLATHLLNEHDNEVMEFAQLRGSVADDLHGAFAEWQLQAETLTKCKNYLYSVSINPDHTQGEFTREHYMTFIERMEDKLGLSNQPRAIVFHCKHDREHCHVVYSRIDVENQKAVHMAFDKDKLMMVTRQFARDHGIQLPEGYYKARGQHEGKEPLSLYEKRQYEETGLTKSQRMEQVTDLWRQSDSAKAFVAGLEEAGYVLCTGRRDYVLVDYYGHMNALPKLIDDKQIRTKQLREFLGNDYPTDQLPDVDETRQLVREHRQQSEAFGQSQRQAEQLEQLKRRQQERQQQLHQEKNEWLKQQTQQCNDLLDDQKTQREQIKQQYQDQQTHLQQQRDAKKRTGLSATLAKLTGLDFLQQQFHKYQDNQAEKQYEQQRQQLLQSQQQQRESFEQQQQTQQVDFDRKERALQLIEQRELNSLQTQTKKENRLQYRKSLEHMPAMNLQLKPPGRYPMVYRAKHRFTSEQERKQSSKTEKVHTTVPTKDSNEVQKEEVGNQPLPSTDKTLDANLENHTEKSIDTNQDRSADQSLTRQYNEPHQDNSRKR